MCHWCGVCSVCLKLNQPSPYFRIRNVFNYTVELLIRAGYIHGLLKLDLVALLSGGVILLLRSKLEVAERGER